MKKLITLFAVMALAAPAMAQIDPDANSCGIYFDEGATLFCTPTTAPFQSVTGYLCVTNSDEPSGISGWECTVQIVGAGLVAPGWTIRHGGTNFLTAPEFAVGIGTVAPAPWAPSIVLASMTGFVQMPGNPVTFAIAAAPNPSIAGHNGMVIAAGDDATNLIAINPSAGYTGGVPNVCAGINYCDITSNDTNTWGGVKALFE
jgi:hypothetical protein